jgi:hypothetical protein
MLVALAGCQDIAGPDWFHPGTAAAQQKRALRYDPYPENDSGPSTAGTRPRDFDIPPPEPSRARWEDGKWGE